MPLKKQHITTALTLLYCTVPAFGSASPITANVIGPEVGEANTPGFEYRSGIESDSDNDAVDGRFTDRIDLFYNVTDDSQFRVFFNRVNPGNGPADVTNMFIEPAFQLFKAEKHGFDGAILTGLTLAEGDNTPHQARTVLSGEVPYGRWAFRHNSIFAHQLGPHSVSGLRYEARWRVTYKLDQGPRVGVEMFNNFANLRTMNSFNGQTHRAGPVMTGKLFGELGYQTGILAGLNDDAPDLAGKFWVNYRF